jgi:alginate O-acetyltransferase complex protein AlgI
MSLYFYYKCSGAYIWLLVFSIVANYYLSVGIVVCTTPWVRKFFVGVSVCVCVFLLSYFKYTAFFIDLSNSIFGNSFLVANYLAIYTNTWFGTTFDIRTIILPVGISFYSFQALSYTIDLYRHKTLPVKNVWDFGFYKTFFPQLVAGPIVRAAEFIPQICEI